MTKTSDFTQINQLAMIGPALLAETDTAISANDEMLDLDGYGRYIGFQPSGHTPTVAEVDAATQVTQVPTAWDKMIAEMA